MNNSWKILLTNNLSSYVMEQTTRYTFSHFRNISTFHRLSHFFSCFELCVVEVRFLKIGATKSWFWALPIHFLTRKEKLLFKLIVIPWWIRKRFQHLPMVSHDLNKKIASFPKVDSCHVAPLILLRHHKINYLTHAFLWSTNYKMHYITLGTESVWEIPFETALHRKKWSTNNIIWCNEKLVKLPRLFLAFCYTVKNLSKYNINW